MAPNLTVLGKDSIYISAVGYCVPKGRAQARSFRQTNDLPGTPKDGFLNDRRSYRAREKRGERQQMSSGFLDDGQSAPVKERERVLSLKKQNLRKEARMMFPLDFGMLIALRMITVTRL